MSRPARISTVAAALLSACGGSAPGKSAQTHVVEIRAFEYHPSSLAVMPGDTVVWVNRDAVPHTATSGDGAWDSGSVAHGASWSVVVSEAAMGAYTCDFHPSMTATLMRNESPR